MKSSAGLCHPCAALVLEILQVEQTFMKPLRSEAMVGPCAYPSVQTRSKESSCSMLIGLVR